MDNIQGVIDWNKEKLGKFKRMYAREKKKGEAHIFMFEGNLFVVAYAKYLIQYLEGRFKE